MSKLQLHASGMELLSKCGIAFERRYILGEKSEPSASMAVGTAVDRSVRLNLTHKKDMGSLLRTDEVRDAAHDALLLEWGAGVRLTDEDKEDGNTSQGKALDMSVNLAGLHHRQLAPSINPTHVARKFVLDVKDHDIQVAGEIDIEEGIEAIRDTKTTKKSPVKTLADESLQLSMYSLAIRQLEGALPKKVVLDFLIQTPARGDLKLVQLESRREDEHLLPVLARIGQMERVLKTGLFTPAPVSAWWCARKYCSFWETCQYAARRVSVPIPDLIQQLQDSIHLIEQRKGARL